MVCSVDHEGTGLLPSDNKLEIENRTQWHPAFCASMELELAENKKDLTYDREHNLSSEPLRIDLLIIKKNSDEVIRNEIGTFFLGHNIVEYKSPDDKVNIDTFYKVLSYACLYKSDTGAVDEILDTDITITLIREQKPEKLLGQLDKKYKVIQKGRGIYHIEGMLFPMQIVVTKQLDERLHIWLKALTRSMDLVQAEKLLESYDKLYDDEDRAKAKAVVNLVSDLNNGVFEQIISGGKSMSEALKEMILPELGELKIIIANKDAELEENRAELEENRAELEENRAELAQKNMEIAELKRMLAEARGES